MSSLAMVGSLGVLAAAPASAEVDTKCGTHVCVNTAHHDTLVQDITVYTKHGGAPGILRAFVRDFNRKSGGPVARFRVDVNRDFAAPPKKVYVCGGLDRGGKFIENICVKIRG